MGKKRRRVVTSPKKRFAQHFLIAPAIVRLIVKAADCKGERVLEIGAGKGVLTGALAAEAKHVVAIELDRDLIPELQHAVEDFGNVEVVCADAMKTSFDYPVVVGNIPYYLSSALTAKLLESRFKRAVFTVQKEFAERLVAPPNSADYGRLSVIAQAGALVEIEGFVPASCFSPEPETDSAVVVFRKKKRFEISDVLVTALFQHKNQSVKKALLHSRDALGFESKGDAVAFCAGSKLSGKRVRTLSLKELEELSNAFGR